MTNLCVARSTISRESVIPLTTVLFGSYIKADQQWLRAKTIV